jgi:hypothetical protein
MNTVAISHWGPYLWGFIHTISVVDEYDNVQQNMHVMAKLRAVKDVIPCPSCVQKYEEFLKQFDFVDVRDPLRLFYWSVDLHNDVNAKLGKPLWSYRQALLKWTKRGL